MSIPIPEIMSGGQGGQRQAKKLSGEVLADRHHLRHDIRMMRRLIRNPVYVPNEFFAEGAKKLWDIVTDTEIVDQRVRVAAAKTIVDICKVNLEVHKHVSGDKPAINLHLHRHEHNNLDGLSEDELDQLKELMDKAGFSPVLGSKQQGGTLQHASSTRSELRYVDAEDM
jgi:hypothetical protein